MRTVMIEEQDNDEDLIRSRLSIEQSPMPKRPTSAVINAKVSPKLQ